jgi:hypothetical protein
VLAIRDRSSSHIAGWRYWAGPCFVLPEHYRLLFARSLDRSVFSLVPRPSPWSSAGVASLSLRRARSSLQFCLIDLIQIGSIFLQRSIVIKQKDTAQIAH